MRFSLILTSVAVASAAYVPGKAFDRFITIWLENEDYTNVTKDGDLSELVKQGILLTQYHGLTHPSQPNYIASVGGDYFGLDHDDFIKVPKNVSTIVDLLDTRSIDWRGYFEGLPGPGYMGEGSTAADGSGWDYVRKHNPFVCYDSVAHNGTRLSKLLSLKEFHTDVKTNSLPQFAHISPNMLNNGHDTSLNFATKWTLSFLKPLLANKQFMEKTLILLTYDESETYEMPNRIVSILLGGAVPDKLKGTEDDTLYSHYSILSTVQNNWDLPSLGRYDVGANVFNLVAAKTGYKNHPSDDIAAVNNSLSYGGFLNSDPSKYLPIPPPNINLIGAGGKGVVDVVRKAWKQTASAETPYNGSSHLYDGGDGQTDTNAPVYQPQGTSDANRLSGGRDVRYIVSWVCAGLATVVQAFVF